MSLARASSAALAAALLALASAAPAGALAHRSLTARQGETSATVAWTALAYGRARDVHLTIVRAGARLVDDNLPPLAGDGGTSGAGDTPQALTVRDLDGDGEPEVIVDLYTGGAHCCSYSRIYRYPDQAGTGYAAILHEWGDVGYALADLDGDGRPELRSADDRFAYAFTCFACSGFPIQIWRLEGGAAPALADVTRAFPQLVRRDGLRWWRVFLRERGRHGDVRGVVAAWAADQYLLGRQDRAAAALRGMVRRRELGGAQAPDWPTGRAYVRRLKAFLHRTGYDRPTATPLAAHGRPA